jgi:lipopolysaccharide export system permease protein
LVLYDGHTLNQNGNKVTNFEFSKSDFGISNMESHFITHPKLQEQSTISLINCLQFIFEIKQFEIINCKKDNPRNVYKELFKRLVNPFYLPVLILISLLLILTSKENLKYNKNKFLVLFVGFGIIILSESSLGYITNNLITNISISTLPIILIFITYFIFIYKLIFINSKKL